MAKRILYGAQARFHDMLGELWRDRCAATGAKVYHPNPRDGRPKVYAVRQGKHPGIYYTHLEAEAQVAGFSCAEWRSFKSMAKAMEYMAEAEMDEEWLEGASYMDAFTDGSCCQAPQRAGWGFLVLSPGDSTAHHRDRGIVHQESGPVCTDPLQEREFLGQRYSPTTRASCPRLERHWPGRGG